jgi:hypothetical protein
MTAQTLTAADWRNRIPWHIKAKILAELDTAAQELATQVDALKAERAELTRQVIARQEALAGPRVLWGDDDMWTPDELKAAHAAYARGDRDEWTVAGHRIWDKQRNRRRKGKCPDCGGSKELGATRCEPCRKRTQTRWAS